VAYNYLDETQLADALHDSEEYMKDFYDPIPELMRITRGKPGRVPAGKPKVTDGTLAGVRRETPKQIIQQPPTGVVTLKENPEVEGVLNGTLTDVILRNANSGGTPYAKSLKAIKSTIDVGSAWAECFYNRRGSLLYADYRLKFYRDVLFEKGKVSEFDANYILVVDWMTEGDIKAVIWQEKQRKHTETEWNLKALQELLDKGPADKDQDSKSPAEKKANAANGYFKLIKFRQIGVGATWYIYAPTIKKTVYTCTSKDPRGVIPVHGLVPEEDDGNPLGEPLAAISAPKQNLLDFDMQMYQYGQGLQYSPPTKLWGTTPAAKIQLVPDRVIKMEGSRATDDFEAVQIGNNAINNFPANYGLIKSQILNELGRRTDSSISSASGNVGFSKTPEGLRNNKAVTDVSDNHLRKSYELWQGRIFETLLNIHVAESVGKKELDLQPETIKRYKLDTKPTVDYGKYGETPGVISFTVNAGTSQAADNEAETEKLTNLMTIKSKIPNPDDKDMLMYNQIVSNAGVDNADKLKYSDEEILEAQERRKEAAVLAHETAKANLQAAQLAGQPQQPAPATPPPPKEPKLLGESIAWKPGDLSPAERAQALAQVGVQADSDGTSTPNAVTQATETATKIDKHVHDKTMAIAGHVAGRQDAESAREDRKEKQPEAVGSKY
jgi:hypothetical protein